MKIWMRVIIAAALISVLLYFVDWKESINHLKNVSLIPVISAFFILSVNIFVSSLKWKILLRANDMNFSWWELARCYWISTFFGNYLPTSVGGDIVRLMMLNEVGKTSQVAASIFWERLTGFMMLLSWMAFALLMRPLYFKAGHILILLWLMVAAGFALFAGLLLFGNQITDVLKKIIKNRSGIFAKIISKISKFTYAVNQYRDKRREILISLILSAPFYFIGVICNYLVFNAVGSEVSIMEILYIMPAIYLVSLLPISLNGLGISEGAFVFFFSQAGVSAPVALAAAVIRRILHLMVSLVGGILWLPKRSKVAKEDIKCISFTSRLNKNS